MRIQYAFNQAQHMPAAKPTLDKVLSHILWTFQPLAAARRSFIINDIEPGFTLDTDEAILEQTLESLLMSVISRSKSSCIRISARRYNNIVLLRLNDNTGRFIFGLEDGLYHSQVLASKIGGCIMANDLRKKTATITLTFVNTKSAA